MDQEDLEVHDLLGAYDLLEVHELLGVHDFLEVHDPHGVHHLHQEVLVIVVQVVVVGRIIPPPYTTFRVLPKSLMFELLRGC